MIKVLDLFSGTHSIGKCCEEIGWEVVSLDYELPATHQIDILEFDYKQYPKDTFQIIWASPDCCYYSVLQNCWLGKKKKDGIIFTKEILEEYKCKLLEYYWNQKPKNIQISQLKITINQ